MVWKGKFDVQTIKITTNKGNTMFTIIRKKTLDNLKSQIKFLSEKAEDSRWKSMTIAGQECQIKDLRKKVNDQREIIVNMMILLDFFSQKLLRKHNKKGGKK